MSPNTIYPRSLRMCCTDQHLQAPNIGQSSKREAIGLQHPNVFTSIKPKLYSDVTRFQIAHPNVVETCESINLVVHTTKSRYTLNICLDKGVRRRGGREREGFIFPCLDTWGRPEGKSIERFYYPFPLNKPNSSNVGNIWKEDTSSFMPSPLS